MKLIWTKNSLPLSKMIRWGLNEPVSHFALVFDEQIVLHSNLKGVHIEWLNTFKKTNTIVYELDVTLPVATEETIFANIADDIDGRHYDFGAFFFFMAQVIRTRITGKKRPAKNSWEDERALLCTGLADYLPKALFPNLSSVNDFEIISPYQLYLLMKI